MIKNILTVILGVAGLFIVYTFMLPHLQNPSASMSDGIQMGDGSEQIGCTMDAKMCPDGSYVGRSGPTCEFEVCPTAAVPTPNPSRPQPTPGVLKPGESVICTADAKICPDGSGVGRVGPNCEFAACPGE